MSEDKDIIQNSVFKTLEQMGFGKVGLTSTVEDCGMDSLDRLEFAILVERELKIDISTDVIESWSGNKTIQFVCDSISNLKK